MNNKQQTGAAGNLLAQLDKLQRHNRQGSFKTKERYYEAMKRFCRFVSERFNLQKLANISDKHMIAYVEDMQERELAASTIKTELAAIRFWHDKIPEARYKLPSNEILDLEKLTLKELGCDDYRARKQVSQWLGHERDDVTKIYLASLPTMEGGND